MADNNNNDPYFEITIDFPAGVKLEIIAKPGGVLFRMTDNAENGTTRSFDIQGDAAPPIEGLVPWTEYYRIRRKIVQPAKKPETESAEVG